MPATAARGQAPVSPRDPTGLIYTRQLAEAARRKAIQADPEKYRKIAWREGFDAGHREGHAGGMDDAVTALLSMSETELLARRTEYQAEFGATDASED
jgi:hypothetical protein